ncbi:hypothetical protein RB200_33965 [Streptomyces sp. PmtG]
MQKEAREAMGRTTAKAGELKEQTVSKAGALKDHTAVKADELIAKAADAAHTVQDKVPEPVKDTAAKGAAVARGHRVALLVPAVVAAVWLVWRRGKR